MDTNTLDYNTIMLMVMIAGSWLTLVGLIIFESRRLDTKIDTKFGTLDTKIDTKFGTLDGKIDTKIDALDTKFTDKIDALDTKFTDKIDALDTKFTDKFDAFDAKFSYKLDVMGRDVADTRERPARIEGHLMAPEGFSPRPPSPPPAEPAGGERQAG